jgi:hypothetical protein
MSAAGELVRGSVYTATQLFSDMSWTTHRCQSRASESAILEVLAAPSFATCPFYELIRSSQVVPCMQLARGGELSMAKLEVGCIVFPG